MLLRALTVLLLVTSPVAAFAQGYPYDEPDIRVSFQCDAAANRALIRLGGADVGAPGGFAALPTEAPRSTAPVADVDDKHDAVCTLRDGTEIRLRMTLEGLSPSCRAHFLTLWIAARRVLSRVAVGACGDFFQRSYWDFPAPGRIGWVVSPSRIDVCRRPAPPTAGPNVQCRIAGDPRLMGVRDWIQYPVDGRPPRRGEILTAYAEDPRFCAAFVLRGQHGAWDQLVIQAVDSTGKAISELDDAGRPVLVWERATSGGSLLLRDDDRRYVVVRDWGLSGGIRIRQDSYEGRTLCLFRRSGDNDYP